jgi:hypothetical protein
LSDIAAELDVGAAAGADAADEALSSLLLSPPQAAAPLSSRPPVTMLAARTRVFT